MVMAMEAWARFSTTTPNFIHIEDSHMQTMAAALASPQDVILFFSYSGSTKDMEEVLELAEEQKTPIILVTHFPKSRAAEIADVVLQCGYSESPTIISDRVFILRLLSEKSWNPRCCPFSNSPGHCKKIALKKTAVFLPLYGR